ncbi:glycosyltransferase family 1 protein [Nocardioides sp. CGMCC 1.13656]|nr:MULTISPECIES: glycosyltransferase [unclassified Nocardioides]MBA2953343.1 glycosyltransferase family 1 protein [Nocardioides sp. CGMCC 1.13656]
MARVLFTSCPAYGHALPLLPLIRAAQRAGHDVRVTTGPDLVGPLAARGLDVHAVGPTWDAAWSAHEAVWAAPGVTDEQKMTDGVVSLFGAPALARLDDLVVLASSWRPDVVVHEVLEVAGSMLAARLGIPAVVHGIGPMFPFYAQLIDAAGAAIGAPELWAQLSTERALDLCPPSLQPDGPRPWPGATAVRPSAGEPGPLPSRVADVLASDRPVAYFTLGTVKNADTADLRTGLEALQAYDGVVVATTGRRLDPDELGPVPANVLVAEFLPQAALLERADLLVSHSGSGTMLGGLVHGVPQVALPRGTDQPENAALLVRAGAGLLVGPQDYAVESIAAAVAAVSHDPAFRAAAERVRAEIAAMPDADSAWAELAV